MKNYWTIIGLATGVAIALLLFNWPAHAAQRTTCTAFGVCVTEDVMSANPHIIHVDPDLSEAARERERAWLLFCDPTFDRDQHGVEHYVFKHDGCEYGRSK